MSRPAPFLALAALVLAYPASAPAQDAYGAAVEHIGIADAGHAPVLTKVPQLLQGAEPVFPEEAKAQKLTGDVTLAVEIGADGRVSHVEVTQSAGHGFDEAAMEAVQKFIFRPAEIDGKPAPVRVSYTQHFVWTPPPAPPTPEDAGPPVPHYPISIQGKVLERATRKPLANAAVQASNVDEPAITGLDGTFQLRAPPGEVTITVKEASHHPFVTQETIQPGEQLHVTYYMMPKAVGLYETVVREDREKKEVSRTTLSQEELQSVPGSMGDPIRVIQDLPGVARVPFLSGQLIVRGAAPGDTASLFDGVDIPNLYHFLDGPSVINPEFLDRIDFYPGGFGPEYGRAIGGAIDIETKAPKENAWQGSAKVDLLDGSLYLAAPIIPGLSISVAARRSIVDAFLNDVLPLVTNNSTILVAPSYYDYQLRLDYHPPEIPKNTFKLFFFGSDDLLKVISTNPALSLTLNTHQGFQRLSAGWTYRDGDLLISTSPYVGHDTTTAAVTSLNLVNDNNVGGWREKLEKPLSSVFTLRMGLDFELYQENFTVTLPYEPLDYRPFPGEESVHPPLDISRSINENDYGEWIEGELKLPAGLKVFPGVRVDEWQLHNEGRFAVDPRLTVRKELGPKETLTALKGGIGLYNDSPGAYNLDPQFGNPSEPLQSALQTSVGVEHRFSDVINLDVTAFYNRSFDMAVSTDQLVQNANGQLSQVLVEPIGLERSYGLEVLARHEITKHFFGWLAYTLSWAQTRTDGTSYVYSNYDERHILTLIAQYRFDSGFQVGGRFRLVTGMPTTEVVGSTFDADEQLYSPVTGPINGGRLPTFNQLDVRVDKVFLFDRWQLGVYLDVQNVYNETNEEGIIYDYRYQGYIIVPGLPFFPTLGVKASF